MQALELSSLVVGENSELYRMLRESLVYILIPLVIVEFCDMIYQKGIVQLPKWKEQTTNIGFAESFIS